MKTAVGVGCDPNCRWKTQVLGLEKSTAEIEASIPTAPYDGNQDDVRPTAQGYHERELIRQSTTGLMILSRLGSTCANACAIERFVESSGAAFGSEVVYMINNLKGVNNG